MGKTLNGGSRGATRGRARRFPGKPAADEQERGEERPRGQVVSERHAAQSVDVAHTQTRTQTHTGGTEEPLSGASASPDGPSVWPCCPAGRPASGAHRSQAQFSTSSLAGGRADRRAHLLAADQTRTRCSLLRRPKKRKSPPHPVNPTDQELSRPLRRFKDGDAIRRRIPAASAGEAPLFCSSKRAGGLSKTGG